MKARFVIVSIFLCTALFAPALCAKALTIDISALVPGCGDGVIQGGEECDGLNLNGTSCSSFSFSGGTLSCTLSCTFNTTLCTSGSSSGGGGGGGGSNNAGADDPSPYLPTDETPLPEEVGPKVSLKGFAFPFANISILRDGVSMGVIRADARGAWYTTLPPHTPGAYLFTLFANDSEGTRTSTSFSTTILPGGVASIEALFLPPTVRVSSVGQSLLVQGMSTPGGSIVLRDKIAEIGIREEIPQSGAYQFSLSREDVRTHSAAAAVLFYEGVERGKSALVSLSLPAPVISVATFDLDDDDSVGLVDFSILMYWYEKESPPADIDFNKDGAVNLQDLSVMAFYWTG